MPTITEVEVTTDLWLARVHVRPDPTQSPEDTEKLFEGLTAAAPFIRRIRKEVRATVASFTDSYQYTIDQLIEEILVRCREQNLRLTDTEKAATIDFIVFLTVQTMNYLHSGRHRVAL